MAAGSVLGGLPAEYFGRKKTMICCCLVNDVALGFIVFSDIKLLFNLSRILVGISLGREEGDFNFLVFGFEKGKNTVWFNRLSNLQPHKFKKS